MITDPDDVQFFLILVVSGFIAFLLIFSFLYYFFKKKRRPGKLSPVPTMQQPSAVPASEKTGMKDDFSDKNVPDTTSYSDITEEILAVRQKYSLDSLTVASYDGLVVLSSGNPAAESDAAYFTQCIKTGEMIGKEGVNVYNIEFNGSPLLIITKSDRMLTDGQAESIKNDIGRMLRNWL